MTLSKYYQRPVCRPPLKSDSQVTKADHLMVEAEPITAINNVPARQVHQVKIRKMPASQIIKLKEDLKSYDWTEVFKLKSAHEKADLLQNIIMDKLNEYMPITMIEPPSEIPIIY